LCVECGSDCCIILCRFKSINFSRTRFEFRFFIAQDTHPASENVPYDFFDGYDVLIVLASSSRRSSDVGKTPSFFEDLHLQTLKRDADENPDDTGIQMAYIRVRTVSGQDSVVIPRRKLESSIRSW